MKVGQAKQAFERLVNDVNDFLTSNSTRTPAFYIKPYQFLLVGFCLMLVGGIVLYFFLPDLSDQIDKGKTFLPIDGTYVLIKKPEKIPVYRGP